MNKAEKAKQLFLDGYNCAQAVFCVFAEEMGVDDYTYSNSSGSDRHGHIVFDAAKGEVHNGSYSNLIYGKSDTVQPPAIQVQFIIKY